MAKPDTPEVPDPFGPLKSMIEQFKLPGVDMAAIAESRRKDVEALLAANKAAFDAMQQMAQKQGEVFAGAMQSLKDSMQAAGDPVKQSELARQAYEKAVAQMRELAEIARKAQADALAGIDARVKQVQQELQQALQQK